MYDVIIIGAGVSGAAAARELSRYRLKICCLSYTSAFWSEKRMYAVELPRQTAESLIPVMMQNREALWRN